MADRKRAIGRPRRFAKFEEFEASLPKGMKKRALYCDGIGLFRGAKSYTVWVKIRLRRVGSYKGRTIAPGGSFEHKLGNRASWDWQQLIAERDKLQGLADRGEPVEVAEVPTFGQYAEQWLERKKSTLKSYALTKGQVSSALSPSFGKKALNAITIAEVNQWIGKQSARLKPASVQRHLGNFNSIMNDAVKNGVIERKPAGRADRIRGVEARQRFITSDEWERILAAADTIEQEQDAAKEQKPQQIRGWLRHYVVWAYNSGMRRGEILRLTFANVREVEDGHTVVEVVQTKSGKPRFVTCTEEMKAIVAKLRKLERLEHDDRLFPVSLTTLKRSLTKLWKKTGLGDVRLHDLRRTHATILIKRNIDPRTVAGRLGHSGTAMLAKHYAVDLGDVAAAQVFGAATDHLARKARGGISKEMIEDGRGVRQVG